LQEEKTMSTLSSQHEFNLTGLKCPMPIVMLSRYIKDLNIDEQLTVFADDPAFCLDVEAWCNKTGHELQSLDNSNHQLVAVIRKRG